MTDHPWNEIIETAKEMANDGHAVYQKFTCARCGVRLTVEEANTFHTHGTCEQCGHVTDIQRQGCNYLLVISAIRNSNDRRLKIVTTPTENLA